MSGLHGGAPGSAKADAKLAAAKERAAAALRLRRSGLSLQEIAESLGYASKSGVSQVISRAIRRIPKKDAEAYRADKLAELEELRLAAWPAAMDGDPESIRAATAAIESQCKLSGAYAPIRGELFGPPGPPPKIEIIYATEPPKELPAAG